MAGLQTVPVLEFWHFEASAPCWKNIACAFQSGKSNVHMLALNDAMIDDSAIEYVAECIAAVRHVELTFGQSSCGEDFSSVLSQSRELPDYLLSKRQL